MLIGRWASHAGLLGAGVLGVAGGCSTQSGGDPTGPQQGGQSLDNGGDVYGAKLDPGPRPGPPGAGAPATAQPIRPDDPAARQQASVACLPGLGSAALRACEQGLIRFQEVDSVSGTVGTETGVGLGPAFNGNSCAMCHAQPAILGSSPATFSPQNPVPNPQIALATLDGAQNVVPPFIEPDGPIREVRFLDDNQVHDLFTIRGRVDAPGCEAMQPDFTDQNSFRIPIALFGDGLVENTPEDELEDNLATSAATFGTEGTFNIASDGTILRFGWKAQLKSLLAFSGEAYNVEQGVTNENFPDEKTGGATHLHGCLAFNPTPEDTTNIAGNGQNTVSDVSSDIVNFAMAMRLSHPALAAAAPFTIGQRTITAAQVDRGSRLFVDIGCAGCHTPTLTTAAASFDPAMSKVTFHPYSDFALHHMGPRLADGITQGNAGPDQFRTAPLWGIGQRLFFLHDGRTRDLTRAILQHGGDADQVIAIFQSLRRGDQQDIVFFLRSL